MSSISANVTQACAVWANLSSSAMLGATFICAIKSAIAAFPFFKDMTNSNHGLQGTAPDDTPFTASALPGQGIFSILVMRLEGFLAAARDTLTERGEWLPYLKLCRSETSNDRHRIEATPTMLGVLAGSVRRGGHNPLYGPVSFTPRCTLREATHKDFNEYRVCSKGYLLPSA